MSRYHPDLLDEIEVFLARQSMPSTTFGRMAMNDPHFVRDIRGDRCLRPESVEKVRGFIEAYSPSDEPKSPRKPGDLTAAQQSEAA